ncbi:MAG: FAD-dependent oxidoreductase [Candidatus Aminicenantes bacterium]|nr:FAD-dependent oxidoreductase [Candidatus Aminicenantes bacterium]
MRIIVVGNGLAGTIFSKTVHDIDPSVDIQIYSDENYRYYPRPNLIEFLAGNLPYERLFAFSEEWYESQNIHLSLGESIKKITPASNTVELHGGGKQEKYDVLLLANGAHSFFPPFRGIDKKGVFALRTLDDALNILEYVKARDKVAVVGGGLLGLEIARALRTRNLEVEVVEFFPRLLPRQLDIQGAEILKLQIEKMGIGIFLGKATEEILGDRDIKGLQFKGGETLEADAAIVAAGVRPNIQLAADAGLEVDRGIVVNDYLQTSHKGIFAAGDGVQYNGQVPGIISASFEQARIAASNVMGFKQSYQGTIPANTLKVAGIDVTSIGNVNPEEAVEEVRFEDKGAGVYKKIVVQKGEIIGAIWMGTKKGIKEINQLISQKINIEEFKTSLLNKDFDFSAL